MPQIPTGAVAQCIISYLEELVEDDAAMVNIWCPNPDPDDNGLPTRLIECCGPWTEWKEEKFGGDSLHDALANAVTAKRKRTA